MDLFDDLRWRGLAYQWTGEDTFAERLRAGSITVYHGLDPSSASLHHGNLVGLTMLRRFQRAGHNPIALLGGATGMIGDPSGKSEERNLLSTDEVIANVEAIRPQVERFIDLDAGGRLVNNADWFAPISYIGFLRDVGKHASVNVMLARESVRARMGSGSGISYTEFSYSLLQAYDFVHLYDEFGCELQMGGSDQYGNIVSGVDLGRRMRGASLFGLTWPLLTRSDGKKFGKTADGALWLDPRRTSPFRFYQWFVQVPDADASNLLRTFTDLEHDRILELEAAIRDRPQQREAQQVLAHELTLLVHGEDGVRAAERATQALFGGDLDGLGEAELLDIFADVPSASLPATRLGTITVGDALVEAGLAKSKGEARRLVEGGGAYVNNRRAEDEGAVLSSADLAAGSVMVLRQGKRSFALLRFEG